MAITCPECLSMMPADEGVCVVCPACKTEFTVLFRRAPKVAPAVAAPAVAAGDCCQHPGVAATATCMACGAAVCQTCAFPAIEPGRAYCPACASVRPNLVSVAGGWKPVLGPSTAPLRMNCQRHPQVQAIHVCASCGAAVCATCDFELSGVHLCPKCATAPPEQMSPKRRKLVWAAMAIAIWCTLAMVLMCGGAAFLVTDESSAGIVGLVAGVLVGIPSIVGGALGLACLDRRLGNPPIVWVAAIWNGVLMSLWLLTVVIGVVTGG
jgi:hypothetical protein